tara:strand:- start:688 stop:945 length:258 start_codon:yes stop_codon:yes gene_type:complete
LLKQRPASATPTSPHPILPIENEVTAKKTLTAAQAKLTFGLLKKFIISSLYGTPDRIRTYDPRLRRPLLYPAELPEHNHIIASKQ